MTAPTETPSPTQELEVIWQVTPTPGFLGGNSLPKKSIARGCPQSIPRPIGGGSDDSFRGGDCVY